ncbi:MAG TPA: 50S ribosomal protein L11 methyltransferase [Xanthobacteraceae bacterium]|nr:50S ribosomal protein L11 methyltransferase [Xanthobacteraceae bacterium]
MQSFDQQDGFVVSVAAREPLARRIADEIAGASETEALPVSLFEEEAGAWRLSVHCPDEEAAAHVQAVIAKIGGGGPLQVTVEGLARRDWVAASLAGLAPVRAGRFFLHGAHDRAKAPRNAITMEIEAALAFGTGHHGTTKGCLLALDRLLKTDRPRRVADIGTGTAVLAIAVAKALRRPVSASEIDRQAVAVARANARANGVGPLVRIAQADGLRGPPLRARAPYDLILANILLGPLKRLARPLARAAAPRARLVLSGLLTTHANAALAAYRAHGFRLDRRLELEGWTTLVLRRGGRHADRIERPRPGRFCRPAPPAFGGGTRTGC